MNIFVWLILKLVDIVLFFFLPLVIVLEFSKKNKRLIPIIIRTYSRWWDYFTDRRE